MVCAIMMRIGIISDTHGLLRPEAIEQLAGSDHIIHAGDIGAPEVIDGLQKIAPTTAVRGNIDVGWAKNYPDTQLVVLGGRTARSNTIGLLNASTERAIDSSV